MLILSFSTRCNHGKRYYELGPKMEATASTRPTQDTNPITMPMKISQGMAHLFLSEPIEQIRAGF